MGAVGARGRLAGRFRWLPDGAAGILIGRGLELWVFERLRSIAEDSFLRAVGILVGGTALAQVILGLTLPITTRLYLPADFSVLAVFAGIVSILSVSICLRYDIAVALPKDAEDGAAVVVLAAGLAASLSIVIAVPAFLAPEWVGRLIGQPRIVHFLWLVPVATFLAGLYSTMQFWFVRNEAFGSIARNRVAQALASSATQIGFGLAHIAPIGLLLGQTLNSGAGGLRLSYVFLRDGYGRVSRDPGRIWRMASVFRRFPAYSTFEALANSGATYLPIIMLGAWAEKSEAGYLMLGIYALQLPISLVGRAMAQVYMSRGPEERRAGRMGTFTAQTLSGLMKTGVGPLICLGIAAPQLFDLVFGHNWIRAGVLVAWMTPSFIFQFLSSPMSLALHISNRLATAMLLQVFGLILRPGAVYLATLLPGRPLSEAYALSGLVFYACYLVMILRATETSMRPVIASATRAAPIWLGWAALGGTVYALLQLFSHALNLG